MGKEDLYDLLGNYDWLAEILQNYAYNLLKKEDISKSFTSHDIEHSKRIIQIISVIIDSRIIIKSHESFVLIGAAYLHDIAIANPVDVLPEKELERGWYEADLRQNHGERSAEYIRNVLFPKLIDENSNISLKIRENSDLIEGIARICYFHTAEKDIYSKCMPPSNRLNRISLLASLFVISDGLDAGFKRVRVNEVLNSPISYKSKEHWLLRSTIVGFEIKKNTIIIKASKPKAISEYRFKTIVLKHLIEHLNSLIKRANIVFKRFEIRQLSLHFRISSIPLQANIKEINQLNYKYLMDQRVKRRIGNWKKLLDSRTIQPGVIDKKQIEDELHIFRRWGSSTHRFFSSRRGLQKGGGYFLAWNNLGLLIDPGYDLISNAFSMRHLHFTIRDFHGVIITHAHDDHTHDLEPIISLEDRIRKNETIKKQIKELEFPIICSEGVRWKYSPIIASNQFVKFYPLVPTKNSIHITVEVPNSDYPISILTKYKIKIQSIMSFHGEAPWHLNNTGLVTKIYCRKGKKELCIGYTSDTGYNKVLIDFLKDTDLLLIHLGNKKHKNGSPYPDHHLGEGGVTDLISNLKFHRPKLFLIGEFGAEEFISGSTDDRIVFTQNVEQNSGAVNVKKRVLPADIGLRIKLPDLKVWCEYTPRRSRPTADNPSGVWADPLNVSLRLLQDHEIHYLI